MFRSVIILVLCYFLYVVPVKAYEFKEINTLWNILFSDYTGELNLKNISLHGGQALTEIDESIRLYNSDSKAFLYEKNNLIATFELPNNNNNFTLWQQLLEDILTTGVAHSAKLSENYQILEDKVIIKITESLDQYSRVETNTDTFNKKMTYKFINGVLYVHPAIFYNGVSDYLKKIISSQPNIDGVILDLRDNRGGDFNEALKTADLFLDNSLITYRKGKNLANRYYISNAGDILEGKPIIILTNEKTASSAEIVTAALGEQSRAILVGTKTYGKNTTQITYQNNQQKIFITNGVFYTPSGKQINHSGISPKICTGLNNSCIYSDKNQPNKDIYMAIRLIKENFG